MTEYLLIKIDRNAYEVALETLYKELTPLRALPPWPPIAKRGALERAIGAFYAAALINKTTKTQHA